MHYITTDNNKHQLILGNTVKNKVYTRTAQQKQAKLITIKMK